MSDVEVRFEFLKNCCNGYIPLQDGIQMRHSKSWSTSGDTKPLAPELILLLPPSLSNASLNSLILTCRRLWEILQPDLEARLTPSLASRILYWAAASKPHIMKKLLSPPHNTHPNAGYGYFSHTPLHVATDAGNAVQKRDFAMAALLLDHGAQVDACCGADGTSSSALHTACSRGYREMVDLLLARGAQLECRGHFGTALGFAVRARQLELVRHLLAKGADATVVVPLYILLDGAPAAPLDAELLYVAMQLRRPRLEIERQMFARRRNQVPLPAWTGVPLEDAQRGIMALLLAHGASKDATIARISKHLTALAKEAERTEEEFLEACHAMIKEAEDAVPDVLETNTRN
ncbi:ankyrin repeat-containing domain protein [Mycena rebaudengoi]|nr:ankyrin repeat-containing domain protein [Mycena rebaudengoi]